MAVKVQFLSQVVKIKNLWFNGKNEKNEPIWDNPLVWTVKWEQYSCENWIKVSIPNPRQLPDMKRDSWRGLENTSTEVCDL